MKTNSILLTVCQVGIYLYRIHENDATDGSFWEALSGILELIYFGMDPAKVCLSVKFYLNLQYLNVPLRPLMI
jgi:hypothetical protein